MMNGKTDMSGRFAQSFPARTQSATINFLESSSSLNLEIEIAGKRN